MLAERMNVYQANTGKTPQRIIIFRNGVSEVGNHTDYLRLLYLFI